MNARVIRLALRSVAVAIAVVAAIDPTLSRPTRTGLAISVVQDTPGDSALAGRVRAELARTFTPVIGLSGQTAATVLVGDGLPVERGLDGGPTFVVAPDGNRPRARIERVDIPQAVHAGSRVEVGVTVATHRSRGRTLDVALLGWKGEVHRSTQRIANDTERVRLRFNAAAPTGAGPFAVQVHTMLSGAPDASSHADAATYVDTNPARALFYDARPSWMSTFVRRVAERDARFTVASRISTSRAVSSDAQRPPSRLDDATRMNGYDIVVVGAPEALPAADVAGVESFLRDRGGTVVLLLDSKVSANAPFERLTAVREWSGGDAGAARVAFTSSVAQDSVSLRAGETVWPARLPVGASVVAGSDSAHRPVIWTTPVGAGRLVVSGALDAWRYRDPSESGFDAFWREFLVNEAARSWPAVTASLETNVVEPGAPATLNVQVRDALLGATRASWTAPSIAATAAASIGALPIRLYPDASVGTLTGQFFAPTTEGVYAVRVASGANTTNAALVVRRGGSQASAAHSELLDAITAPKGGRVVREQDMGKLNDAILSAIGKTQAPEPWHPMRSPLWLIPFAAALCAEWWLRRRRGLS